MLYYDPLSISAMNYPYCFKHEVFTATELQKILKYCKTLDKTKAKLEHQTEDVADYKTRISDVSWIRPNTESKWIFDRIAANIDSMNKEFYQYDLFGFSEIQYAEYDYEQLGKYDYHTDIAMSPIMSRNNLTRKLSASLLLNDTFEGGEFQYNVGNSDQSVSELVAGTIVVFPSYLLHRVKTVTKGIRRSLTVWCVGPKFK